MLAFLFEGQIFYSLADAYKIDPAVMVFCGVAAMFAGLLLCGLFIKSKKAAKRLFLCSYPFFIAVSAMFYFPPSVFWTGGTHRGFVSVRRLRGSLGVLPEKQHAEKRTDQNSRGYVDLIQYPHGIAQYGRYPSIAAHRAGVMYVHAVMRLRVRPEAPDGS